MTGWLREVLKRECLRKLPERHSCGCCGPEAFHFLGKGSKTLTLSAVLQCVLLVAIISAGSFLCSECVHACVYRRLLCVEPGSGTRVLSLCCINIVLTTRETVQSPFTKRVTNTARVCAVAEQYHQQQQTHSEGRRRVELGGGHAAAVAATNLVGQRNWRPRHPSPPD